MAPKSFTASIEAFRDMTTKNMRYVAAAAIQDVLEAAQTPQVAISAGATTFVEGKIPVDTAALINSLSVDNGGSGSDAYVTAIAGMEIGDVLRFRWTAPYSLRVEVGFTGTDALGRTYNQAGRHFVSANAARFPQFVADRVAEVKR